MAVIFPAPPGLNELIRGRGLAGIVRSPLSGAKGQLAGVAVNRLSYTAPHQNWYSTLDALMAGRFLADAEARSWRYLLCEGDRGVGELETTADDRRPLEPSLTVHEGSAAQLSIDALRFCESIPEVQQKDFEARFLKVPALNFTAIWLHADDRNLIVVVTGGRGVLMSQHAYSESEVVDALRQSAEQASKAPAGIPGR